MENCFLVPYITLSCLFYSGFKKSAESGTTRSIRNRLDRFVIDSVLTALIPTPDTIGLVIEPLSSGSGLGSARKARLELGS